MIQPLLEAKSIFPPDGTEEHLCLDAGYVWPEVHNTVINAGYIPHVRPRWEDLSQKKDDPNWKHPDGKPRRWIVEVAHSWFNNFRKIRIKYEKKSKNYLALLHIAAAIICFRKINLI
jgi:putative transposase